MYSLICKTDNDVECIPNYLQIFIIPLLEDYFGKEHKMIQFVFNRQESLKIINKNAKNILNNCGKEYKICLENFVLFLVLQILNEVLPLLSVEDKREFVNEHEKRYKEYLTFTVQVKVQQTVQTDYKTTEFGSKSRKSMQAKNKVNQKDKWPKIQKYKVIELFDYKTLLFFINEFTRTRKKQNEKTY